MSDDDDEQKTASSRSVDGEDTLGESASRDGEDGQSASETREHVGQHEGRGQGQKTKREISKRKVEKGVTANMQGCCLIFLPQPHRGF